MVRKFELYNKSDLSHLGEINIVNEPKIFEEINGSFNLDFEIDYRDRAKLNENVLVKADGQYFQIARIVKSRYDTITLSVYCEHASYEMIVDAELTDALEFEADAATMINEFLQGTRFTLVSCIATGVKYYTTNTLDKRKRLFDVANLFGGELVFDNFNISLVHQRGSDKGLDIKLGVNLIGVTEEINFVEGRKGYEIDLVDLSKVAGYELDFSAAELGDTITIIDDKLGINTNERILSIEYNPFRKALPTVSVGDYARDLTEYFKDDDEEKKSSGNVIESFLTEFKIGLVDALSLADDESSSVEGWLKGEERYVRASASYTARKLESLKGVFIEIASEYNSYYQYLINTTNGDNKTRSMIWNLKQLGDTDLSTWDVPANENDSFTVFISETPIEDLQANPSLLESTKYGAVGIEINVGESSGGQFLYKFEVGEKSVLSNCSDEFEQGMQFVKGQINNIIPTGEYLLKELADDEKTDTGGIYEQFKGVVADLLEEYQDQNYYFYLVRSSVEDKEGQNISTIRFDWNMSDSHNAETWNIPDKWATGITFIISQHSWEELQVDDELFYNTDFAAYGVTFKPDLDESDPTNFFNKFDLQDTSIMHDLSNQNEMIIKHIVNGEALKTPSNTFEISENQVGLFVETIEDYNTHHLTLIDFRIMGNEVEKLEIVPYGTAQQEWNYTATYDKRGIIIVMSKLQFSQLTPSNIEANLITAVGVTITKDGEPLKEEKLYLEFGTAPLADEMTLYFKDGPYDSIKSVTYGFSNGVLSEAVSVSVEENKTDDKITSLTAYATSSTDTATVNFKVIAGKMEVVKND